MWNHGLHQCCPRYSVYCSHAVSLQEAATYTYESGIYDCLCLMLCNLFYLIKDMCSVWQVQKLRSIKDSDNIQHKPVSQCFTSVIWFLLFVRPLNSLCWRTMKSLLHWCVSPARSTICLDDLRCVCHRQNTCPASYCPQAAFRAHRKSLYIEPCVSKTYCSFPNDNTGYFIGLNLYLKSSFLIEKESFSCAVMWGDGRPVVCFDHKHSSLSRERKLVQVLSVDTQNTTVPQTLWLP